MRTARVWQAVIVLAVLQIGLTSIAARGDDATAPCCADLERLLSELTAPLSGGANSGRTLRIYGQLNRALLYWDDGDKSRVYAVDNDTSSSRLGLVGEHRVQADLSLGYRIEIDSTLTLSSEVSSGDPWGDAGEAVRLRHAYAYLEDSKLGRLTFGQQSPATDDVTVINLGSQMNDAALHYNNNFGIWLDLGAGFSTDLKWGQIAHNVDSLRGVFARYDTPMRGGFVLSAALGVDDVWDVAVRYQVQSRPFRFAAGIGYMDDRERRFRDLRGSASLIHDPSGLYVSVAGGVRDDDISILSANGLAHFQYAQLGISKQWLPYGKTTLYADYGRYKNFNVGHLLRADLVHPGQHVIWGTLAQTEVRRWGIGAEQAFDKHGLLVYAQAHHYSAVVIGFPCDIVPAPSPEACGGDPNNLAHLPTKDWFGLVAGARIRF